MLKTSSNQKKRNLTFIVIIGIISFLIILYKDSPPVNFAKEIIQNIFDGPREFVYGMGKNESAGDSTKLKNEVKLLQEKIVDYELVKKDNEALRNQFETSGETTKSLTAASILGFIGDNKDPQELIINVGKKEGIVPGMTVVFNKDLVGKVMEVANNYSVVMTPYNPKFQVLAKLVETEANGIVVGRRDLMIFDGVLITDELKKDGIVLTKGEVDSRGIGIIPDYILGKITSISKIESAPFQSAQIEPLIDYSKLTKVFVVSKM